MTLTRLQEVQPTHHYHRDTIPVDEEAAPQRKIITQKGRIPPRQEEIQQETHEDPAQSQRRLLLKEEQALLLHLLDLDGPKGGGKSLKNWEMSMVITTL